MYMYTCTSNFKCPCNLMSINLTRILTNEIFLSECITPSAVPLLEDLADSQLTASSSYGNTNAPSRSRLSSDSGWAPGSGVAEDFWIQADFGQSQTIVKIATRGRPSTLYIQWITSYKLAYTLSTEFSYVLGSDGNERLFAASVDSDTIVEHCIDDVSAVTVRLYPQTWYGGKSLLWELYASP